MAKKDKEQSRFCKKPGCKNLAINGYCSKDHAPFARLIDDQKQLQEHPLEWVDLTPIGIKEKAHVNCKHSTQDPYMCAAIKLQTSRSNIPFDNRCLCSCHVVDQLDPFEEDP